MDYSNLFVCLMGLGTVFFGLICIIILTYLMSFLCRRGQKKAEIQTPSTTNVEPDRQELVAAVSAALAEELGTSVNGIRILSMKKL